MRRDAAGWACSHYHDINGVPLERSGNVCVFAATYDLHVTLRLHEIADDVAEQSRHVADEDTCLR